MHLWLRTTIPLAVLFGIYFEKWRRRKVCDCEDGECCKSFQREDRYKLPHAHITHWSPRPSCDPKWDRLAPTQAGEGRLILIRHGQSVWNRKPNQPNALWRYAGSIDIPLSDQGIQEAFDAGKRLSKIPVDVVFCSQMDRARATVSLALSVHESGKTPVVEHNSPLDFPSFEGVNDQDPYQFIVPMYVTPTLNERNFGDLQGVPSTHHTDFLSSEELRRVRNDFNMKFPGQRGESCADVHQRVISFFESFILPHLNAGRSVLLSTHGFVMRTLIKYLDDMSEEEFNAQMQLEKSAPDQCKLLAATGVPMIFHFRDGKAYKKAPTRKERADSLSRSSAPY